MNKLEKNDSRGPVGQPGTPSLKPTEKVMRPLPGVVLALLSALTLAGLVPSTVASTSASGPSAVSNSQ